MSLQSQHLLKLLFSFLVYAGCTTSLDAQTKLPILKTTKKELAIQDGEHVAINWQLDRRARPDNYYVNVPGRKSKVTFKSDLGKLSFKTSYGTTRDFIVLLNEKDSFFIRIVSKEEPIGISLQVQKSLPDTIPFTLRGSRIELRGLLNGKEDVAIQFDLGAGGSAVSKASSDKLNLSFTEKAMLSNTQGINEVRKSADNHLTVGNMDFHGISFVETGNMQPGEDLLIGNYLFRDKIIEFDYDKMLFIVHEKLPAHAKTFNKQLVFYEQHRPKFKARIVQNGKKYSFWFIFDTGRDGAMQLGEDFTGHDENWKNLKELSMLNGRKVIRLDATIAGVTFKDILTRASDPTQPAARRATTLIGNQLLNHFNVILDNPNGYLYLKPNGRRNEPYSSYYNYEDQMKRWQQ
jgi:hypothetical protein